MDEHERALLLSVRPKFAESILNGSKTAEIRRQRPDVRPGTLVIIYATKPKGAIVGTARVSGMSQGSPDEIWKRHKAQVGISREDFDSYLEVQPQRTLSCLTRAASSSFPNSGRDARGDCLPATSELPLRNPENAGQPCQRTSGERFATFDAPILTGSGPKSLAHACGSEARTVVLMDNLINGSVRERARTAALQLDLGFVAGFCLLPGLGLGLGFPLEPCGVFAAGCRSACCAAIRCAAWSARASSLSSRAARSSCAGSCSG